MQTCLCGAPMLGGVCVRCGGTIARKEKSRNTGKVARNSSSARNESSSRIIPDYVNFDGKKSLPNYFGYSTSKGKKGEPNERRSKLTDLIHAQLLPTNENSRYVESFGPPGSRQRIMSIAELFKRQVGAQYYVDEGHTLWHSKRKKKSDIQWLLDKIDIK